MKISDKTHRISEAEIQLSLKKSGYFLEQRMANHFSDAGFSVVRNSSFADPLTGKSREIDLEASLEAWLFDSVIGQLEYKIICECKNKFQPIVFFKHKNPTFSASDFIYRWAGNPKTVRLDKDFEVEAIRLGDFGRRMFSRMHDTCSQWCSFKYHENQSSWLATGDEEDYLSISSLITATRQQMNYVNSQNASMHWTVFHPLLIMQNDIYVAWENKGRTKLKKCQHLTYKVHSSWFDDVGRLRGDFFNISVINEQYVKTFSNQVKGRFEYMKKSLSKNKPEYFKAMNWSFDKVNEILGIDPENSKGGEGV